MCDTDDVASCVVGGCECPVFTKCEVVGDDAGCGINVGLVVGLVVGAIAAIVLLCVLCCCCRR
jgi:hypothetical protein